LKLGKFFKIILFAFDVVLLLFIVDNFVRNYAPTNEPIYWIGVAVEIALGWLTYWFWMRSTLVSGFKFDKLMVIILMVLGLALPNAYYISGLHFLNPAAPSDLFFYFVVVSLTIYSSYRIDKFLATNRPRTLKSQAK
jgi:hypothetical protein